jgi:menaquinol-cytochrome c reductase iron-sulfur subunit
MSKNNRVSRRQFLSYTLTGVGGFMAAGMLAPMVRFAIDPVLQPAKEGEFIAVTDVKELSNEPKRFDFKVKQVDAWYESEITLSAWVFKQENGDILALSPICKHLGCTVDWEGNGHESRYFCPCHNGLYEKDGTNVPGTPPPAPLNVYDSKVENDTLYLGKAKPRGGA